MIRTPYKFMFGFALGLSVLIFTFTIAQATSLTGTYFKIPINHPDVQKGIDPGTVSGLVTSTLGPNGLPVASSFAITRNPLDGSGPITDLNTNNEILWWSATSPYGVLFEKTQIDSLPFNYDKFYPDGKNDNSEYFRAVHWQGTFTLPSPGSVTFTLGADDDTWVYVDGILKVDNGGVKPLTSVPNVISGLSAGTHPVDIFFADRHRTESAILFSSDIELHPNPVSEPTTILLLSSGLIGLVGLRKKFRK